MHVAFLDGGTDISIQLFVDEMFYLWNTGIILGDKVYKVAIIATNFDTRGYEKFYGMQGAGSAYGCNKCDFTGIRFCDRECYPGHRRYLEANHVYRKKSLSARHNLQFVDDCPNSQGVPKILTWQEYVNNSREAQRLKKPYKGCKKLSPLHVLPYAHKIAKVTDAMHCFNNVISICLNALKPGTDNRTLNPNILKAEVDINSRTFSPDWTLSKDMMKLSDDIVSNVKGTTSSDFPKNVWTKSHKLKSASKLHYATRYINIYQYIHCI